MSCLSTLEFRRVSPFNRQMRIVRRLTCTNATLHKIHRGACFEASRRRGDTCGDKNQFVSVMKLDLQRENSALRTWKCDPPCEQICKRGKRVCLLDGSCQMIRFKNTTFKMKAGKSWSSSASSSQNLGKLPVRIGTHDASLDYMRLTCSVSICHLKI